MPIHQYSDKNTSRDTDRFDSDRFGEGEACDDDDDGCRSLYKEIHKLVNILKRRYADMRIDSYGLFQSRPTGKMSWAGHIQQYRQVQSALRSVLKEAEVKGCFGYQFDAWTWATKPPPSQPSSNTIF